MILDGKPLLCGWHFGPVLVGLAGLVPVGPVGLVPVGPVPVGLVPVGPVPVPVSLEIQAPSHQFKN